MAGFLCFLGLMVLPLGQLMPLRVLFTFLKLRLVGILLSSFLRGSLRMIYHDMAASSLSDHRDVWTDGSLVLDQLTGVSSSVSRFFAHQPEHFWRHRWWGHVDGVRDDPDLACCKGFCSVPGPLQSDEDMILHGRVREEDKLGNDAADEAADFGRRRVGHAVIDARRNLSGVCGHWYPVILDFHRFFIAVSRAVVNHDGRDGTAPNPLVWSAGALPKRRRLVHAVRDRAFLPGPPGVWHSEWFQVPAAAICAEDIALWPFAPGRLVKWVSFLNNLHWPVGDLDLGVGGVSFVELLILYELWAGERLSLEKAHNRYLRPGRPISVSAVPIGPGIDIWRSCRFIGALMRSLCLLPGGLRRFVPCSIGANHCRLRHIGWESCGHGLTSRPRESAQSSS